MTSQTSNRSAAKLVSRNELSMPKWVTEQSNRIGPLPPPPPISLENGQTSSKESSLTPKAKQPEPDYEVIEFCNQQYSNTPIRPGSGSSGFRTPENKLKCTLCGSGNPWVTCGECSQQIFCASCDDMFHKHPKRRNHQRKTIETHCPPLPPKFLPGQPVPTPPVAPPRRNKRGIMTPIMQRKDQGNTIPEPFPKATSPTPSMKNLLWQERLGSYPKGLNLLNRPLPETPKTPSESSRSTTPKSVFDKIQRPPSVALEKIKSKANATLSRMQLLQQRYRQQKEHMKNGAATDQRQMALQQSGQRGMSSSVFNLNQINRQERDTKKEWTNNSMQQAQSMAQLNCGNCNQHQLNWKGANQHSMHNSQDPWSNQLSSQHHLNCSNMSLNVPPGYMMQSQMNNMYPSPPFINQRNFFPQMYPQSYMGGMAVMNPDLICMPPLTPRAASRVAMRMASPALSRKSVTLRRKQRSSYIDDEATDDEDSDEYDVRSIASTRSGISRVRQRRMSSGYQCHLDDDIESTHAKLYSNRTRNQRKNSLAQSVHSDWAPSRKTSNNNNRSADSGFNSPLKHLRIYSDLDSEGSGTRALVQAKIEQKLKEESIKQKQSKSKRQGKSPAPQKTSAAVQTATVKQPRKQEKQENLTIAPLKQEEKLLEKEIKESLKGNEGEEVDESNNKDEQNDSNIIDQSGKTTETTKNTIEDNLGPPPSTPDYDWECEFCTFVNEVNIKICSICCKTPTAKPKKAEKSEPSLKQGSPLNSSQSLSAQRTMTTNMEPKKIHNILQASITRSSYNINDHRESTSDMLQNKETVEDIWTTLDENIQTTTNATTVDAQFIELSKGSASADLPFKTAKFEYPENLRKEFRGQETNDTLTKRGKETRDESIVKSEPRPSYKDVIQESDFYKYTAEELNAALKYSGSDVHPIVWLRANWPKLIQTVQSLATKYGQERSENTIGTISEMEARDALRLHTGNIWQAVSECIEQRQKKFREISLQGNFSREDIVTALTTHQGNVELALLDLGRTQLQPFLMRIWGSPGGVENESGSQPLLTTMHSPAQCKKGKGNQNIVIDQSTEFVETENTLPELPVEEVIYYNLNTSQSSLQQYVENKNTLSVMSDENLNKHDVTQDDKILTTSNHFNNQNDSKEEDKEKILNSDSKDVLSAPTFQLNKIKSENSFPALQEARDSENYVTTPSNENQQPSSANKNIIEVKQGSKVLPNDTSPHEISDHLSTISVQEKTSFAVQNTLMENQIKQSQAKDELMSGNSVTNAASTLHKPLDDKSIEQNNASTENHINITSTKKVFKSTQNKKKTNEDKKNSSEQSHTSSKIPKPKETTKEIKQKELVALKRKNDLKKNVYTRSKSFSGPSTPIGIASVKTISQKFLSSSPNTQLMKPKKYLSSTSKSSVVETINKFTNSSSLSEKSAVNFSLKYKTQPRIPKKKYHETCFSDDDYESSSLEEETEPLEIRQRKLSVPVFKAYPSVQEPEDVNTQELIEYFMKENLTTTVAEAQLAATLVSLKFSQDVSLWAAKECSDLDHAIALLKQECELCSGTYALNQIVSMLKCIHKCCKGCAKNYFTVQITERSINDCNCPFCKLPALDNQTEHEDENLEYFSNLDIFLKNILEPEVHELFQRKLRDRTLLKDPNFKWCMHCSSGFFSRPKQKRLICPDCGSVTCAQCRKTWQKQHEGISCDQFAEWESANDPEVQAKGVLQHLEQNGIDCPKCKFKYSLARGGCMHFTCTQCKYEFCYGCTKPFMMGAKCTISPYCAKLGLHAHHPRNCLFYLRDKLPVQLQILLKNHNVPFEVDRLGFSDIGDDNEASSSKKKESFCPIPIQKETPTGLVDTRCNGDVPEKHAGMCRNHYVEYLTAKVAKAKIDPLPIFDLTDCVQELRRRGIPLPERGPWDTDEIYKNMCAEVIKKNIPLDTN